MKIVTGYTGTPHITANDDQARNQGIFGAGNYVLNTGNKLNAVLTNATTVTLVDGDGVMQGVHFRIEPGMTEAVSISSGTPGYNRIDLICARYIKDAGTGIESVNLVVIEGTPSTSTPSEPPHTTGNILAGDTLAEFPIWKVTLTGLTPVLSKAHILIETAEQISNKIIIYSGTVSSVPAESPKAQTVATLPSSNYIILGVLFKPDGANTWHTPTVAFWHDGDPRIDLSANINVNNNILEVVPFNTASIARDIQYRIAIMAL
jgi:hypothetical protein